jgi:hypothetical protein
MPTGAARSLTTEDGGNTLSSGIGSVGADGSEVLPAGLALIRYRPNDVLISETSVTMASITHFGRIFVEVGGPVNTGVAIGNPTAHTVTIDFAFVDTSGAVVKTGTTQLFPFARVTRFVNEAPFSLKGDFIGTLTIGSSGPPVSIMAIRGFTNEFTCNSNGLWWLGLVSSTLCQWWRLDHSSGARQLYGRTGQRTVSIYQ